MSQSPDELSHTDKPSTQNDPNHCTICVDSSHPTLRATIPSCNHTFCLSCLLSWSQVREICPNCKSSFSNLLVARNLSGDIVAGPVTCDDTPPLIFESLVLLQRIEWLKPREVLSPLQDLQGSFMLPEPSYERSPAPHYLNEEFEDELESQFWEEEDQQYNRLMRHRVMSNRRFGANGYISSGRQQATPRAPPRAKKQGGASAAGASSEGTRKEKNVQSGAGGSSSGGRKKKVKKKSRQGIMEAKKKAEDEARAAASAGAADAEREEEGSVQATVIES